MPHMPIKETSIHFIFFTNFHRCPFLLFGSSWASEFRFSLEFCRFPARDSRRPAIWRSTNQNSSCRSAEPIRIHPFFWKPKITGIATFLLRIFDVTHPGPHLHQPASDPRHSPLLFVFFLGFCNFSKGHVYTPIFTRQMAAASICQ
jgi:hypothetical protein